jgi:hypothetical protein
MAAWSCLRLGMNLPVDLRLSSEVDGVDRLFCDNSFMDYTPLDRLRAV